MLTPESAETVRPAFVLRRAGHRRTNRRETRWTEAHARTGREVSEAAAGRHAEAASRRRPAVPCHVARPFRPALAAPSMSKPFRATARPHHRFRRTGTSPGTARRDPSAAD